MGDQKRIIPDVPVFHYKYTSVPGFFLQDDPATDPVSFDYVASDLGLINRSYPTDDELDLSETTQWQRFERYVRIQNEQAPVDVQYKVLFFGRHGEGYHNVAEAFYGTKDWDCYWSKIDGNGTITWADARITEKGEAQALVANSFWKRGLAELRIPAPESYYASPMDRCLATSNLTFSTLDLPASRAFKPVIKELLRESLGVHTCDRRSSKTAIADRWPGFSFESGFADIDPLWDPEIRESDPHITARLGSLMDDVFAHDSNTFISLTSHSGAIAAVLRALGHRRFPLQTGGVIPILVMAEKVAGAAPRPTDAPGHPAPDCNAV